MKKNDIVEFKIVGMTSDGSGIGKLDSMVFFIDNVAVGDVVRAKVLKVKKKYAFAKLDDIIVPSADRQEPDCEIYLRCGGCCFRHINYQAELKIKKQTVFDCLNRIAKVDSETLDKVLSDIVGAKETSYYRNKVQLPIRTEKSHNVFCGFFALHSHRVVSVKNCKLQPVIFNKIIHIVELWANKYKLSAYDEKNGTGYLRHLFMRIAESTGEIMICLVVNSLQKRNIDVLADELTKKYPEIKSVMLNINNKNTNVVLGDKYELIKGQDYIIDNLCGLKFKISPQSFYQINHKQTEKLYELVRQFAGLTGKEKVLDLFCGIGTIGLSLSNYCQEVLGIEIIPEAIENAKENAKINGIENARFICADANMIKSIPQKFEFAPDVVVIDPPRKGCSSELISDISVLNPKKVVYVSCNPSTLARDVKVFIDRGFELKKVTPVDMFPRTVHVETVCLLS